MKLNNPNKIKSDFRATCLVKALGHDTHTQCHSSKHRIWSHTIILVTTGLWVSHLIFQSFSFLPVRQGQRLAPHLLIHIL